MQGDDKDTVIRGPQEGGAAPDGDADQTQVSMPGPADGPPQPAADADQTAIIDSAPTAPEPTELLHATDIAAQESAAIRAHTGEESSGADTVLRQPPMPADDSDVTQILERPSATGANDVTQIQAAPDPTPDNDVTQLQESPAAASDGDVTQIREGAAERAPDPVTQLMEPSQTGADGGDVTQVMGTPGGADAVTAILDGAADGGPAQDITQVSAGPGGAPADITAVVPDGRLSVPVADGTGPLAGASSAATEVLTGDETAVSGTASTAVVGGDATAVTAVGASPQTAAPATGLGTRGLRTGTGGTTGLGGFRSSGKAAKLAPGDVIDQRFVLVEELGRGGMSVVFRARDSIKEEAGDANPMVALKILRGDFSLHPDAWIALQQEISKTQSLSHPHIVTVHDFKIDRELGLPFAQMEEMVGESLEDLIKRHPDGLGDPKRIGEILMAVADGLGYAHSQGIVHADMKPSNVFITEEGDVKLLDFGIARFIPGKKKKGGRDEVFGEGGLSALTPTYASPEMFAGESPLPADDIYALGVIAVELGSGGHPFASVLGSPKPAVAAADAGLVPERFPGLKNSQWKAISSSLRADRERRPVDGYDFLAQYRPKSIWLRAVSALTVLLAIAVVVVWIRGEQKRPDIPFEELPLDLQVRIEQALESGEVALNMRDVNGALFYYAEAFELHPNNRRAITGHESVVDVIADAPVPENRDELRRRLQQANALLAYPALEDSRKLRGYLRDLERLQIE